MSRTDYDWPAFIVEVIPADVIFQIEEGGQLHTIEAHKMILGIASPTFKTMFYTTDVGDKTTDNIKIQATTKQAFQIIIDDLYKVKSIKNSLKGKSLREIFDVVNLIERYQMSKLQKAVNDVLSKFPITDDTVLEVAVEAIYHSRLFQKEAHLLLITSAKFLKRKLKDAKSIFKYVEENEDQKEVVYALLAQMNGITECSNCGYEDCRDGKEVEEGEFREGLLVTNNPASSYLGGSSKGTGKVTSVDAARVTIEQIKDGVAHGFTLPHLLKTFKGSNSFLFVCN